MILIVEDEADASNTLQMLLSLSGYHSAVVSNGQEALRYLQEHAPPCLILLDLFMPVMDGVAFLQRRRQNAALARIPVIVYSGEGSSKQDATANGADLYLSKPARPRDLLNMISGYCGECLAGRSGRGKGYWPRVEDELSA